MTPAAGLTAEQLTAGDTGTLLRPGDNGWDQARTPWLTHLPHQPLAIALVRSAEDVSATVRSAAAGGLAILAQGTGHGASPVVDGSGRRRRPHTVPVSGSPFSDGPTQEDHSDQRPVRGWVHGGEGCDGLPPVSASQPPLERCCLTLAWCRQSEMRGVR